MLSATTKLAGKQFSELKQALLDAYNREELRDMLRTQLNIDFDAIVKESNLEDQVSTLIGWFERRGTTSDLIKGAMRANPTNPMLIEFDMKYPQLTARPLIGGIADDTRKRTTIAFIVGDDHLSDQQIAMIERMLCAAISVPEGDIRIVRATPTNSTRLTVELPQSEVLNLYSALTNNRLDILDIKRVSLAHADLSGVNLEAAILGEANLTGARLIEADLKAADLRGAILQKAILQKANLEGAILQQAILRGADLEGANLRKASLERANLEDASLKGAILEGADLGQADLRGADFWGVDLRGTILQRAIYDGLTRWPTLFNFYNSGAIGPGARLEGAQLEGINLHRVRMKEANLQGASLQEANLEGAELLLANLRGANLSGANLSGADLQRADLRESILSETRLSGANLKGANLQGANLERADLRGASMQGANLRESNLASVKYDIYTRWPDDLDYVRANVSVP